ncbi:MAG: tyrosine-type recombinase/integrase [Pseudomonadota bacterium]
MKRALNKLTDPKLKQAKPRERAYKLADGGGLYLLVTPDGGRYWRLKYRHGGKEKVLALGVYPDVQLIAVRKEAAKAREHLRDGIDPGLLKRVRKQEIANTFEAVAREWHQRHFANLSAYQSNRVWRSLELHVFPHIGQTPVKSLTPPVFVGVLRKLEQKGKLDVAHRTGGQMTAIMDYALSAGLCDANAAEAASRTLKPKPPAKHHPALTTLAEVGEFLRGLQSYEGDVLTVAAIRLLMLTGVRTTELRFAEWSELDLAAGTWEIPAERTKMRKSHVVYLSEQANLLFRSLHPLTGKKQHVFAKKTKSGVISENFCTQAIKRMGLHGQVSGHGFRGTLSTILNEKGHFRPDVIEAALAHSEKNGVRAAYNHAKYAEELRELWRWWANALDAAESGKNVIVMPQRKELGK